MQLEDSLGESCAVGASLAVTSNKEDESLLGADNLVLMAASIGRHGLGIATYVSEVAEVSVLESMQGQAAEERLQPLSLALSLHCPNVLLVSENVKPDLRLKLEEAAGGSCKVVSVKPWCFNRGTLEKTVHELWLSGMPQDLSKEERRSYIFSLLPVAASDEVLGSLAALLSVIYAQNLLGTVEVVSGERLHMLQSLSQFNLKEQLLFDLPTLSALQVFSSDKHPSNFIGNAKEGLSLYSLLDHCHTLQGRRLLRSWLLHPITSTEEINTRLNEIQYFLNLPIEAITSVQRHLGGLGNLSSVLKQVISRQGSGRTSKAHLKMLHGHLVSAVDLIQACLQILQWQPPTFKAAGLEDIAGLNLSQAIGLLAALDKTLDMESDLGESEDAFFVSAGVSKKLDQLKEVYHALPNILNEIIQKELRRIPSSLVRKHEKTEWALLHLPHFGFVVKMGSRLAPDLTEVFHDFSFVSEFCKDFFLYKSESTSRLDSEFGDLYNRIQDLETAIVSQFTFEILQVSLWQELVDRSARLDVILSLSSVARAYDMSRPRVVNENVLDIKNGRHILNEQTVAGSFIPNDAHFSEDSDRIHVITGPNFSGKTVYAKQVALIVYMAHIGSFVPADDAVIGVCDKILTRMDSIDASSRGQSSFMMDLVQVLNTLRSATSRSLLLLDEFGRGTEGGDGFGLFFSILNAFAEKPYPPRVIACTHFSCARYLSETPESAHIAFKKMECFIEHSGQKPGASNLDDQGNGAQIIYLYRLVAGISDNSLGLFCARLAGLAETILRRANEVKRWRRGQPLKMARSLQEDPSRFGEKLRDFMQQQDLRTIDLNTLFP